MGYCKHKLSTIKMLYSLKNQIAILHPCLPIMATSPQCQLSSVPKVAIVGRFNCSFFSPYSGYTYNVHLSKQKI